MFPARREHSGQNQKLQKGSSSQRRRRKKKKIGCEIVVPLKQQNLAKNRFSLSKPPAIKNTTLPPLPPTAKDNSGCHPFERRGFSSSMGATVPRTTAPSWDLSVGAVSQTSSSAVVTAERSGGGDGELPATVPSYHEAAPRPHSPLLRVEGACSRGTFSDTPRGRSQQGRREKEGAF